MYVNVLHACNSKHALLIIFKKTKRKSTKQCQRHSIKRQATNNGLRAAAKESVRSACAK